MSLLSLLLFTPQKIKTWAELAQKLDGTYEKGEGLGLPSVTVEIDSWTLTLDGSWHQLGWNNDSQLYTRLRAPFRNPSGFRFSVYQEHFFDMVAKLWDVQGVPVGDPEFDQRYMVKTNDDGQVRELLTPSLREELLTHRKLNIDIQERRDPNMPIAETNEHYQLHLKLPGVVKDTELLTAGFNLFVHVLNRLSEMGIATPPDPSWI